MLKIFHFSPRLIVNDSDIDKAFGSMHRSNMVKIKNSVSEDWIVKIIVKQTIKIFECYYRWK